MKVSASPESQNPVPAIVVDAHEDIAWNVLTFGRDYLQSAQSVREREAASEYAPAKR